MEEKITTKNIDDFIIDKSTFNFYFFRAMNREVIDKFVTSHYIDNNIPNDFRALPLNQRLKTINRLFNLTALQWFYNKEYHKQALERIVVGAGKKETIEDILNTRKRVFDTLKFCKEFVLFIFDDEYGDNGLMLNAELCCSPPYSELPKYWDIAEISPVTPHYLRHIIQVYKEE